MGGPKVAGHLRMVHAYAAATTPMTRDNQIDWNAIYDRIMSTGLFEQTRTHAACKRMIIYLMSELGGAGTDHKKPADALRRLIAGVQAKWPAGADAQLAGPTLLNGRRPITVPYALWAVWAKELEPHFTNGHAPPSAEETRARAWLLHWHAEAQEEEAAGKTTATPPAAAAAAVKEEDTMQEQEQGNEEAEEAGMEGLIMDDAAWEAQELEKLEQMLVTPGGEPAYEGGGGARDEGEMTHNDPLLVLAQPASASSYAAGLPPLGTELAYLFDHEEPGLAGMEDPRVPALQQELAACKAKLKTTEERLAQLEEAHKSLLSWLAAWASSGGGNGQGEAGGAVGSGSHA